MGAIIETNNLRAYYVTNAYGVERTVKAVDDISIRIQEGEVYGIAGESGLRQIDVIADFAGRLSAASHRCGWRSRLSP